MRPFAICLLLALSACESKTPPPAEVSSEDRALLEKMKARETARANLELNPSQYVTPGKWDRFDKGIINDYTKATAIEFSNNSEFDVSDIQGKVTYLDEDAAEMATVPFSAPGDLGAHARAKFKVSAGEISGKADSARIVVERVRVRR